MTVGMATPRSPRPLRILVVDDDPAMVGAITALVGDRHLDLTPIEYRLAEALVRAGGDLVPHLRLVRAGWPAEADPDLLWLKPHVARLRRKVEAAGGPAILAIRGVGYRLGA